MISSDEELQKLILQLISQTNRRILIFVCGLSCQLLQQLSMQLCHKEGELFSKGLIDL